MRLILALFLCIPIVGGAQTLKKAFRFSTFYAAVNGNNSLSDYNTYSVVNGPLSTDIVETPFDYSLTLGIRKIARFKYENRANVLRSVRSKVSSSCSKATTAGSRGCCT